MHKLKVYCAGAISDTNNLKVLENMRRGIRMSTEVLLCGMAPFCPWIDYHFSLALRDGEVLTIEDYYQYSLAWLEAADVMLVAEGWEDSIGTKAEIQRAHELGKSIYYSLYELVRACCNDIYANNQYINIWDLNMDYIGQHYPELACPRLFTGGCCE